MPDTSVLNAVALCWSLRPHSPVRATQDRLRSLGIWRPCRVLGSRRDFRLVPRRGCRGRCSVRRNISVRCARCDASTAVVTVTGLCSSCSVYQHLSTRHIHHITYSMLNVRSLTHKIDDVLEFIRDNSVDVMCLTESWHYSDDVSVCRLRSSGFNVVDRPRPRVRHDDSTNYGGILIFSASARLSILPIMSPPSFELLCVRVVVGPRSEIVVAIYRPGSQPIQQQFFDDLSAVLDGVAAYAAPVHVVGDFNVRLDRHDDPHAIQFRSIMTSYGLPLSDTGPTHSRGGTIDAVASTSCIDASVVDAGLSDHHAIIWRSSSLSSSSQPPTANLASLPKVRPWRRLDSAEFRSAVAASRLCQPDTWPDDLDELCSIYDSELSSIIDRLLPLCLQPSRRRPSDPWFDVECRASKKSTRLLERAFRASCRRACSSWSPSRV